MKTVINHYFIMFVVNLIGTFLWLSMANQEHAFLALGAIQAMMLVLSAVGYINTVVNGNGKLFFNKSVK